MRKLSYIIGSDGSSHFGKLKFAKTDAKRFMEVIAASPFQYETHIADTKSSPYLLHEELDHLATSCEESDSFIVYFSGHGELSNELLLVLDKSIPERWPTFLRASWIREALRRCRARNKLLIMDCCHAGAAAGARNTRISAVNLDLVDETDQMLLASRKLEYAREIPALRGGFLTSEICGFLRNNPNRASLHGLSLHLRQSAAKHNKSNPAFKVPIPYLFGEQSGDFWFVNPPKTVTQHEGSQSDTINHAEIRSAVERVREFFHNDLKQTREQRIRSLKTLALPIKRLAGPLTNLSIVDELMTRNDDAALFGVATILRVRRDPACFNKMINALTSIKGLRPAATWRLLRGMRELSIEQIEAAELARLETVTREIAKNYCAKTRKSNMAFSSDEVIGQVDRLAKHYGFDRSKIFPKGWV